MNRAYNYITLNHPNLPIPSSSLSDDKPLGKFIDAVVDEEHMLEGTVAVMKSQDMYLPNFSLRVIDGIFSQDAVFSNLKAEGIDLLSSCLFLKGTLRTALTEQNRVVESFDWSQNFKFDPDNKYVHRCPAHSRLHFIHFSYHPDYFKQFLSEQEKWADQFMTKIDKKERVLGGEYQPITFVQERALQNLFDCPMEGRLGEMMLETSILQVVLIQMHLLFNNHGEYVSFPVPKKDLEVMQALKEYLSNTFLNDHTIVSLSKHFATNTNKLMSQFKKVYGNSIFDYIITLRMEYARQLLLEKDMMVAEVARILGYKNPNHFSAAFKKKFGVCPTQVKINYKPMNYKTQSFEITPGY